MNDAPYISDEILNAFVDDQLSAEEKEQVYAALARDEKLKQRMCELRSIHDLARLAYLDPPASRIGEYVGPTRRRPWIAASVACLMLCLGLVLGRMINPSPHTAIPVLANAGRNETLIEAANLHRHSGVTKILFHLNSGDPATAREALDEVENALKYYARARKPARIELIANGGGLNLLRRGTSPFPKRIREMQKKYPNLRFVACQNTIDRLRREKGIVVHLLPGTAIIDSGVAQIMRRQQEGWAYIEV
jgi:intracellular sulfur oxidation DsrE/DsrF family protein